MEDSLIIGKMKTFCIAAEKSVFSFNGLLWYLEEKASVGRSFGCVVTVEVGAIMLVIIILNLCDNSDE